jgi:L-rhamnose mutarotase
MIRKAFLMSINPGSRDEYERRHNPIWDDLREVLKSHGVHNYSIYLDEEANKLFAYAEIESETQWQAIAKTDACRRWWAFMKDIMPSNADDSPVSRELSEVFHLD